MLKSLFHSKLFKYLDILDVNCETEPDLSWSKDQLFVNDNIKFLENIKQGFKRKISWNKYRCEITKQIKNNNLDYLIDKLINKLILQKK